MKVLLLADPFSAHIIKWANGIHSKGVDVLIFGLSDFDQSQYNSGIEVEAFKIPEFIKWQSDGNILKSFYLLSLPKLKKVIRNYKCDILHAQSASSYGLLGALANFHPYVISVWGNDVYTFPKKNIFFEKLLKYNLKTADVITSSSKTMARDTMKYTDKNILVTPGGIVIEKFKPLKRDNKFYKEDDIVIGTIKSLERKYGSEDLLNAFNILKKKYPSLPLKLLFVGRGSLETQLRKMAKDYDIDESVKITGFIPFDQIPIYHNLLDIYVAPSTDESESFGVAILEASACGKPVIVSNIGGLPEVIEDNHTGYMVPPNNPEILAKKIEHLILNKDLRLQFGENGRNFVTKNYNYNKILDYIVSIYIEML